MGKNFLPHGLKTWWGSVFENRNELLMQALTEENYEQFKKCLDRGVNVHYRDLNGFTPLVRACAIRDSRFVADLLAQGASVEDTTPEYATPLMVACFHCNSEITEILLEHGASVSNQDRVERTALQCAIYCNSLLQMDGRTIETLLQHGAMVDESPWFGSTLLEQAAAQARTDIVKIALLYGADREHKNLHGMNALMAAAQEGHQSTIQILLDDGANVFSQDLDRKTPLEFALKRNHVSATHTLLYHESIMPRWELMLFC